MRGRGGGEKPSARHSFSASTRTGSAPWMLRVLLPSHLYPVLVDRPRAESRHDDEGIDGRAELCVDRAEAVVGLEKEEELARNLGQDTLHVVRVLHRPRLQLGALALVVPTHTRKHTARTRIEKNGEKKKSAPHTSLSRARNPPHSPPSPRLQAPPALTWTRAR